MILKTTLSKDNSFKTQPNIQKSLTIYTEGDIHTFMGLQNVLGRSREPTLVASKPTRAMCI